MTCRQCGGEKRLLKLGNGPPQFVVCPLCGGTGESDREPVKPKLVQGTIHEMAEQHWQRNGEKW